MDMAVANLFKHKINFCLTNEGIDQYQPLHYTRYRIYYSSTLRDIEKVDAFLFKPFVYYVLSKVLREDRDIVKDEVSITICVIGLEEREERFLVRYRFESPWVDPESFFTPVEVEKPTFSGAFNKPTFLRFGGG